jgi:hypothetical protein
LGVVVGTTGASGSASGAPLGASSTTSSDADGRASGSCCVQRTKECTSGSYSEGSGGNELYCAQCRLEFLKEYRKFLGRIPADVLTDSLVNCGARLHQKGDVRASRGAFDLAFDLGWKGAESGHALLHLLSKFPGRWLKQKLFLAQHELRNKE